MKEGIHPGIAAVIIIVVIAVAGYFIWKGAAPRSDGPSQPVDMGKMMGKDKIASPANGGAPGSMGHMGGSMGAPSGGSAGAPR
jgi:hypothetical protein